jgi:hypothetical protein
VVCGRRGSRRQAEFLDGLGVDRQAFCRETVRLEAGQLDAALVAA